MKYLTVNQWVEFPDYTLDGPIEVSEQWECLSTKTIPTSKDALNCPGYSYGTCKLNLDGGNSWYIEQMDENHYIKMFLDHEYTTTDYF